VAIQSTYAALARGLTEAEYIGCVNYKDYSKDTFGPSIPRDSKGNAISSKLPRGAGNTGYRLPNLFEFVMHKRVQFLHENEIRIVRNHSSHCGGSIADLSSGASKGINVNVDVAALIHKVLVSPYASNWFFECVSAVMGFFKCNIPVEWSAMHESGTLRREPQ
jgi:hypothetical protein